MKYLNCIIFKLFQKILYTIAIKNNRYFYAFRFKKSGSFSIKIN